MKTYSLLFIGFITLFSTIHDSIVLFSQLLTFFFPIFSTKNFHFQLNKLFSNGSEQLLYFPFLTKKKKRKVIARIQQRLKKAYKREHDDYFFFTKVKEITSFQNMKSFSYVIALASELQKFLKVKRIKREAKKYLQLELLI